MRSDLFVNRPRLRKGIRMAIMFVRKHDSISFHTANPTTKDGLGIFMGSLVSSKNFMIVRKLSHICYDCVQSLA